MSEALYMEWMFPMTVKSLMAFHLWQKSSPLLFSHGSLLILFHVYFTSCSSCPLEYFGHKHAGKISENCHLCGMFSPWSEKPEMMWYTVFGIAYGMYSELGKSSYHINFLFVSSSRSLVSSQKCRWLLQTLGEGQYLNKQIKN